MSDVCKWENNAALPLWGEGGGGSAWSSQKAHVNSTQRITTTSYIYISVIIITKIHFNHKIS